jgi:hypothetical protein
MILMTLSDIAEKSTVNISNNPTMPESENLTIPDIYDMFHIKHFQDNYQIIIK